MLARSIPPLQPITARLTTGVLFKFPIPNVDDINVLRPDFDVAGFYNAKKCDCRIQAHHRSGTQLLPCGALRL